MAEVQLKRPTIWLVRGSSDPTIYATFINDTEISAISFYWATSATAADSAWTALGDVSKPGSVTDPFVLKAHAAAGFVTSYYYRARQITASYVGPWSNVIQSNVETFIFELRDAWGLLRGVQLEADTANSTKGPTWFEAMEIMLRSHNALREMLDRYFSTTDIAEIWANPPAELIEYVQADVAHKILARADLSPDVRKERLRLARELKHEAEAEFLRDNIITLSNGETKTFVAGGMKVG